MKISVGPIYFYWPKQRVIDFYKKIANSKADIVYLGEVVCSKRKELRFEDWLNIASELEASGKEVVLSTLTLLEADSELRRMRRISQESKYMIEANDFAAISLASKESKGFIVGPSVNVYNANSLNFLKSKGMKRWCFPVELSKNTLQDMIVHKGDDLEVEVFAFGKLPLAFSARCFTARAYDLDKDDCQYKCIMHSDGMLLSTKEDEEFLTINGIQTMSNDTFNLINQIDDMRNIGVDVVRISPQSKNTDKIVNTFKDLSLNNINKDNAKKQLDNLSSSAFCDGYWFESPGMKNIELENIDN